MERYKTIVDDWEAFSDTIGEPARTTVRRNPLKAGENFEEQLGRDFEHERADWNPDVYRLETEKPGKSILHWRGDYYVQEESAAYPVTVMDLEPGHRVLDMCAAPGGKTTQIAAAIGNKGTVVANEKSSNRIKSLHANANRLGCASVDITNYDARRMPEEMEFDRILVDAPCSGEGNNIRRGESASTEEEREGLADLQRQILEKACSMLAEKGVIVYSTCTFAPEENEEVVQQVLGEFELERIEPDFPHQRGLTAFEEKEYDPAMEKTVRIYPHHLESGGMYVAKIRRS